MDWNKIQGKWKEFRGQAQQKWGKLTNDQLDRVEGRRDELVGQLQSTYGYSQERANREVNDWIRTLE